jgi:predicted enzyme related to lactoylglutathione lyase
LVFKKSIEKGDVTMLLRVWDVTLTVSEMERSVGFYANELELPQKYQFSNYAGFNCRGVKISLVPGTPPANCDEIPCLDFLVDDIDQAYNILSKKGVHFVKKPHDTPWGERIALLADPDGNRLQLVQINWSKYFRACTQSKMQK